MSLNSNILLASENYIDGAEILSSSTMLPQYPADDLKNNKMWKFARFSDNLLSTTKIMVDLGQSRTIGLVSMLKHNLSLSARWRISIGDSATALVINSPTFESGWLDVFPGDPGYGIFPWGEFDWGGLTSLAFLDNYNAHAYHPMEEKQGGRYILIEIDDEAAAAEREDDYCQLARLWASDYYQPTENVSYGAEVIPIDKTDYIESENGVKFFSKTRVRRRAMSASFDLPINELLYYIFGPIYMGAGSDIEVISMLFPKDPKTYPMQAVYGYAKPDSAKHTWWRRMGTPFYIEESV